MMAAILAMVVWWNQKHREVTHEMLHETLGTFVALLEQQVDTFKSMEANQRESQRFWAEHVRDHHHTPE